MSEAYIIRLILLVRLEVDNIKPDILNINETWLHDSIDDGFVSIKDYTLLTLSELNILGNISEV